MIMKTLKLISGIFFLSALSGNAMASNREKIQDLKIEYTKTDVSCFGKTDGKIELEICGGKAPYIVVWDNGFYSMVLDNLRNGEYSVKVCDARGKTAIQYVTIETPSPLQLSFNSPVTTFVDAVGGVMNAKLIGGSPWEIENTDYYFVKINDQAFLDDSKSLPDGEYIFSVEDAHGCTLQKPVLIDFSLSSVKEVSEPIKNPEQQIIKMTIIDYPIYTYLDEIDNQ